MQFLQVNVLVGRPSSGNICQVYRSEDTISVQSFWSYTFVTFFTAGKAQLKQIMLTQDSFRSVHTFLKYAIFPMMIKT